MRVLHISRTMGQGGAEKVVYQLCKDNQGTAQFVASCGGEYVDELKTFGIKHILIPDIEKKNPLVIIKTLWILLELVKQKNVDVLHSHHRMAALYARMIQMLRPHVKHVYTAHNVFFGKKRLLRFALGKAIVVACGDTVKKNLMTEYGLPEQRIETIYNSIELMPTNNIHIESLETLKRKNAYLVGSIGRITEQKGFDVFVRAISKCKEEAPDIVGVIIGDGVDREKIENLAKTEGVEDSIVFLGYQKDVLSIIQKMKFIVLASRWEGFPLTPIETFSVGHTIIVSDIQNNLEIVQPMVNGLAFQMDNVEDLKNKILQLYRNESLIEQLQDSAAKTYVERYSYEKFLSSYQMIWGKSMAM